jgi:hypothetical protein
VRTTRGIGLPQPSFGLWGYIGLSLAEQYGFNESSLAEQYDANASSTTPPPGSSATSVPSGAQAAAGKCLNIVQAFSNAQSATSTAVIETMNGDISNDVITDRDLTKAQQAWTACMARNGYNAVQPGTIWQQYFLDGFAVLVDRLRIVACCFTARSMRGTPAAVTAHARQSTARSPTRRLARTLSVPVRGFTRPALAGTDHMCRADPERW